MADLARVSLLEGTGVRTIPNSCGVEAVIQSYHSIVALGAKSGMLLTFRGNAAPA